MRVSWLALLLVLQLSAAYAEESNAPPDADLLEFLGEWETADGDWFDPLPDTTEIQPVHQDKEKQNDDT